jgi:Fur family ferric uptake transcriptional regulator
MALSWRDRVHLTLRQAGVRRSAARDSVVELLDAQSCALSVVEIEDGLRRRGRPTGRATIYRVLELLAAHKLVERVVVGPGLARFERALPGGQHHHHHLVCERCGRLVAFDDAGLERAIDRVSRRVGGRVEHHEVLLRGACKDCGL